MDIDNSKTNIMPQTLKEIREKQRANSRQYFEKKKNDPEFKKKRSDYWNKWYAKKKLEKQAELDKSA